MKTPRPLARIFIASILLAFAITSVSGAAPAPKVNRSYQSLSEAITAVRYAVAESGIDATAANAANHLRMSFTPDGTQLESMAREKGWSLKWGLHSVGYGGNQTTVPAGELRTNGNRMELVRSGQNLTEWFVNNPSGLEHGFTVDAPPGTNPNRDALRLVMRVTGDLTARADEDGQALTLTSERGEHVLRYEKLHVWDANGREMRAKMRTDGRDGEVWLEVEDAAAVYPLTIDPTFTQQAKLIAADGASYDEFGGSVALDGDTAIVGAPRDSIGSNAQQGSAYVFIRNGTTWMEQQKLTASDGAAEDVFGASVAIRGDIAMVGAPGHDFSSTVRDQGLVYVFVRSGATWTEQQELSASDGASNSQLGSSIALGEATAIIGADSDQSGRGAAYVFVRNGAAWTEQQKLTAADGSANDRFGNAVALSGETALIGAPADIETTFDQGSAYVFLRSGTIWAQQQKLTATGSKSFGLGVAIDGDTAIVGASRDTIEGPDGPGSAYIFQRSGAMWTQTQQLTACDSAIGDAFGQRVAIEGDVAVVTTANPLSSPPPSPRPRSVYVFARNGTTFSQQQKLTASDATNNDGFGNSLALSNGTIIAGAFNANDGANFSRGAAYVFNQIGNGSPDPCSPAASPTPTPSPNPSPSPSPSPTASPSPAPRGNLHNISTRARVLTGDKVLIGGVIISGNAPKKVIFRSVGNSLAFNGQPFPGRLTDPTLTLYDKSGAQIAFNDNWMDAPQPERTEIMNSGVQPDDPKEPAILRTLSPGAYTVIVRGKNNSTGTALVEAYDLAAASPSRLLNLSTRSFVDTGDNLMIGGAITNGAGVEVVVRGLGPSVKVDGKLLDPTLQIVNRNGTTIATNDNWQTGQDPGPIRNSKLAPTDPAEAAIRITLPPGGTTMLLRGKNDTVGIGLLEIYDITTAP